jgi:hypothetical protein
LRPFALVHPKPLRERFRLHAAVMAHSTRRDTGIPSPATLANQGGLPYEGVEFLQEELPKRSLLTMLSNKRLQPREAEHLALGVVSLYQPVAVEESTLANIEQDLLLLVTHPRHETEGQPLALSSSAILPPEMRRIEVGPSCRRPSPGGRCAHRPGYRADDATQEDATVSMSALAEARFGVLQSSCAGQL